MSFYLSGRMFTLVAQLGLGSAQIGIRAEPSVTRLSITADMFHSLIFSVILEGKTNKIDCFSKYILELALYEKALS